MNNEEQLVIIQIGIILGSMYDNLPDFNSLEEIAAYVRYHDDIVIEIGMTFDEVRDKLLNGRLSNVTPVESKDAYERAMEIL